jgi:DNA-binding transcriptional regulator LsrR (DeoR family)
MIDINVREKVLNLYFHDEMGYKKIARELGLPRDTVKGLVTRYRKATGINERGESIHIEVEKSYKSRVKSPEKSTEERIAKLEMEINLLKNFLSKVERRSIKK